MFKNKLIKLIASCLYLGYVPYAPGTFGSAFGLGIYFLTRANSTIYLLAVVTTTILGFFVCNKAEKIFGHKDARRIVIDEASGMLIALMFIPYDIWTVWLCFVLFRFFDGVKPYPLRRLQRLRGAWGVMLDDIGAGIYVNICIQIFLKIAVNRAS